MKDGMKYTPGPWSIDPSPKPTIQGPEDAEGFNPQIAYIDPDCPEAEANAQLIAAAPELLEIVQALAGWFDEDNSPKPSALWHSSNETWKQRVNAVLKKRRANETRTNQMHNRRVVVHPRIGAVYELEKASKIRKGIGA